MKFKRAKLNDRPRDTFSGEAGDEMIVPRRKENGTAPKGLPVRVLRIERRSNQPQIRKGRYFAYGRRNFYESK